MKPAAKYGSKLININDPPESPELGPKPDSERCEDIHFELTALKEDEADVKPWKTGSSSHVSFFLRGRFWVEGFWVL